MHIEVTDPSDLEALTSFVHDYFFSLERLLAQTGEVRTIELKRKTHWWRNEFSSDRSVIVVHNVLDVEIVDSEGVDLYDVNQITMPDREHLVITTGIPLVLRFRIGKLCVTLETGLRA